MKQYINLLEKVLKHGINKEDRTGIGTISIFGHKMRFNLKEGFPLLTTKKLNIRSIIYELLWFLKGDTNVRYLKEKKVNIWNKWADEKGNLGPIYGKQWRNWPSYLDNVYIDQISNIIQDIKSNPNSRRLIVSSWNVGMIKEMHLPPCHIIFQVYVINKKISLLVYQRSADIFLGLPYNIASYSLLLIILAKTLNLKEKELIHVIGDAHIYNNHLKQIKIQIKRIPRKLPKIVINPYIKNIFEFSLKDFKLKNYNPFPHIKGDVAV